MNRTQAYSFYILYSVIAEATGVDMRDLWLDPERIVEAYRRLPKVLSPELWAAGASQLSAPRIAGFSYLHLSTLGAQVDFPSGGEPKPRPLLESAADVAYLTEPEDYLNAGLVPRWREMTEEIARLWGEGAPATLGPIGVEGPVTTAALLAGEQFFSWPYDHPDEAHALLSFCVRSGVNCTRASWEAAGLEFPPERWGIADDFGGMFSPQMCREFVVPYWKMEYELVGAKGRSIHTELLKVEHLPLLEEAGIDSFDPGADRFLTAEELKAHCPVPFALRILDWDMRSNSPAQLQELYRRYASFGPTCIQFGLERLAAEEGFLAIYQIAREMAGEA